jgi:hypothetical protein
MRFVVAFVLVVTILATHGEVTTADCSSPRISFAPEAVDPGDTLTITGEIFWDKCIDTFPTQDVAKPIKDIELTLVQGDSSWVVARGDADENAGFTVEVVIPSDAQPGAARLVASAGQSLQIPSTRILTISTEPAPNDTGDAVAGFGPNQVNTTTSAADLPTTDPESELGERPSATSEDEDEGPDAVVIVLVIAGVATAVALATWMIRRRRALPR